MSKCAPINAPSSLYQQFISIIQVDLDSEYDVVQKIGEGWFSRVYLTEHRATREEVALKAISAATVTADEFLREYQHAYRLSAHKNILTVYDVAFQVNGLKN